MSPDPGNAGADQYSSQSWNAYAHVLGNPLNGVDPSGMTSGSPCENNFACMSQIPGCLQNPGQCAQQYFSASPLQVGDPFQAIGIPVVDNSWVWAGMSSPQIVSSPAVNLGPNATASIDYEMSREGWELTSTTVGNAFNVLAGDVPLEGYGQALKLVGQNVDAQYAFLGKFAASAATAGTAVGTVLQVAALPTMLIGIGPTSVVANPLHFVYGVGGAFQHGLELAGGRMVIVEGVTATRTYLQSPFKLSAFPVLFPHAVLGVEGAAVGNCFTACASAVLRGWGF